MNILNPIFKPSWSGWLIVCLALLSFPVLVAQGAASAADKGRDLFFDDYSLTADDTWTHTGATTYNGSQEGTNHQHKSGWSLEEMRMGRITVGTSIAPALNGNTYVPDINYCAYFRNLSGAKMESPIFTNGVTTLSFDIVAATTFGVAASIKVYIATNVVSPIPTNAWVEIGSLAISSTNQITYQTNLNYVGSIAIRIQRMNTLGSNPDLPYVVIDNVQALEPPPDWSFAAPIYDLNPNEGRYFSFDDYNQTNGATPTWQHIGTNNTAGSQKGTNHLHISGWVFSDIRMGRLTSGSSIGPVLNGNTYVPNTNYCAYFQNLIGSKMASPILTNGVGTLYFDIAPVATISPAAIIKVYIATNSAEFLLPIPPDSWSWVEISSLSLGSVATNRYQQEINCRGPIAIRIQRMNNQGSNRDVPMVAVDNLRVSEPPADVIISHGLSPFNAYPSVNTNMEVQIRIDNMPGPHITINETRTNVLMVSRWNYLNQVTPWVTNKMTCVNIGDGLGNGELWQPESALRAYSDAGNLEYFFVCHFYGAYYQSKDYTVYPAVTNSVSEKKSPRVYSAAGMTSGSSATNTPFVFSLRLFPSSHDKVKTVLFVNGSSTNQILEMELSNTNRWQAKYDIVNHPGVTNLLWYFEATGAYTNNFQATTNKVYWQNMSTTRIQNGALPYGDNCGLTNATITSRTNDWFGVTTVPGESSYVLFTLDTEKTNYIAGRGEYQNFNGWNAGDIPKNYFTASADKYPKTAFSQSFSNGWSQSFASPKSNYFKQGSIYTPVETSALRTGPEPILSYSEWYAGVFQYVVERTAGNTEPNYIGTENQRRNLAVRLFGKSAPAGDGYLQNDAAQWPNLHGIGTLTYEARLSRPLPQNMLDYSMNAIWHMTDMRRSNYVIQSSMKVDSMSPEAPSMSMIAYYRNMLMFYEYRITQTTDSRDTPGGTSTIDTNFNKRIKHEIWKWDGTLTPKLLASAVSIATGAEVNRDAQLTTLATGTYPTYFHVYTPSAGETDLSVRFNGIDITGWTAVDGLVSNAVVRDVSSPLQYGSYGFHSADCALRVPKIEIADLTPSTWATNTFSSIGINSTEWFVMPNKYVATTNFLSASTSTQVKLYTGTTTGEWTQFATHTITDYNFQTFSATTNDWRDRLIRIAVDDDDDIALDGIHVTSWRAETDPITADEWKITEGWVNYDTTNQWYAHLDSSQADPTRIQGVRSEQVEGIGSILFGYRVTDGPAKLKIQYTQSVSPGDTLVGWVDITNLTFDVTSGWVNVNLYLGILAETNIYVRLINDLTHTNKSVIDLDNITIWNNPTNSPKDWVAYNMKITSAETNNWWLDTNISGYMNNRMTIGTHPDRPMTNHNPYIMAPRLTRGLGTISFLARAFTANYAAGLPTPSISLYVTTDTWNRDKPDGEWTWLATFPNITNAFYRPFSYSYTNLPNTIKAVKLVVDGVAPLIGTPQRIGIDEIVLTEAIYPRFDITGVKLLVPTSLGPTETKQPLEGEDIGIEAQLTNILLDPKNIVVKVAYIVGTNTWGGVTNVPTHVEKTLDCVDVPNQIYRITGDFMITGIPEQEKYSVVQYIVWAEYNRAGSSTKYVISQSPETSDHFVNPSWYFPVDFNRVGNTSTGALKTTWSPYYIVYDVPPGAVWINELNLNEDDALLAQNHKVFMNPYVEIAQPAWMSLQGWTVEVLNKDRYIWRTDLLNSSTIVSPVLDYGSKYGLFVIGAPDLEAINNRPSYPPLSTTCVVHKAVWYMQGKESFYPGSTAAQLYPGGYRLKRPMGMYEQSIAYDYNRQVVSWVTGVHFTNAAPSFSYVGREDFNGSLAYTGKVNVTAGRYERTDNTNSWQQGVGPLNWTPGERNLGQEFPVAPMPGGSNVLIISTLLSRDRLTHGWQNGAQKNPLMFKMKKGQATNFNYVADSWFRFYNVFSNNVQLLSPTDQKAITNYTISLVDVQTNTTLVAELWLAPHVTNFVQTADQIAWLRQYNDKPLAPSYFETSTLGLQEEYWLNMDPTQTNRFIFNLMTPVPNPPFGLWLTLEMATIDGSGYTNRVTFLRGDAAVSIWLKDTDPFKPLKSIRQYSIGANSFDNNFLSRTFINGFTNNASLFKLFLDHNNQFIATQELLNNTNALFVLP